jgi:O-antigen ligase
LCSSLRMAALAQLLPLLLVLFCVFARFSFRRFFLLAAIVTLPFRTTYAFGYSDHIGWIDGVVITISDVLFTCFWIQALIGGTVRLNGGRGIARALALFALAAVPSMINTTSHTMTAEQIIMLFQVLVVNFLCMAACLNSREDLETALLGISLCLIIQGVIGCIQFVIPDNFLLFSTGHFTGETIDVGRSGSGDSFIRVFGTLGKPNSYAIELASMALINIALLPLKQLKGRFLRIVSVALALIGLILCASRGSWISVSVALSVYGIIAMRKFKGRRFRLLALASLVGILVFAAFGSMIAERVTANDHDAAYSRVPLMTIALKMIEAHPLIGVGGNTYMDVMYHYVPRNYPIDYVYEVHNGYLLVFSEMGIIGLVALLFLMRSMYREARGAMRSEDESPLAAALGLGFVLVLVQVSVHMLVEMYFDKLILSELFTLAGILSAARKIHA